MKAVNKKVFDNKMKNGYSNSNSNSSDNSSNRLDSNNSGNNIGSIEEKQVGKIDYERLFYSVARAESGGCTSPVAKRTNNCVSIMGWKNGKRFIRKFASVEENKKAFIALWKKSYKKFPDLQLAKCYTNGCKSQGERPEIWLKTVTQNYYKN